MIKISTLQGLSQNESVLEKGFLCPNDWQWCDIPLDKSKISKYLISLDDLI